MRSRPPKSSATSAVSILLQLLIRPPQSKRLFASGLGAIAKRDRDVNCSPRRSSHPPFNLWRDQKYGNRAYYKRPQESFCLYFFPTRHSWYRLPSNFFLEDPRMPDLVCRSSSSSSSLRSKRRLFRPKTGKSWVAKIAAFSFFSLRVNPKRSR